MTGIFFCIYKLDKITLLPHLNTVFTMQKRREYENENKSRYANRNESFNP